MSDELPAVRLRPVEERDLEQLEGWMRIPDVHTALDFAEPPSRHDLKFGLLAKHVEVLLIELPDGDPVGFFLVYFRGYKRTNTREFDIAVPDPRARQQGVAKAAIRAFERWAFDEQALAGVWAKIFADNVACRELVRACAWPLSEVQEQAVEFRGELRDVVYTHMNPELRRGLQAKRGF